MKILLVGTNSKYVHSNLAVRYLKTFTADLQYTCEIQEFTINDRRERVLEEIIRRKPDVVGFSCYIWNIEYVVALAELIKCVNPSIEILYGGPEVSYESEVFLENHVGDYVIEGEGEEGFRDFVQFKLGEKDWKEVQGVYFKINQQVKYQGERKLMNMNEIRFPYTAEEDLKNKIVYYEGSRGCPFRCKYCLSSTTHGVRFLEIERVKKELQFLIDKKVNLVKFVDRTFNCKSDFAMAIWDFLIKQDTETTFHFEISADLLKKEEIILLSSAPKGRFQFEVGVQTTNDEVLKNINRYVNFAEIEEKVLELQKIKNIKQHLDLIAGLPGEDFTSFQNSFNDVYKIQPEEIQLGFLKLLKGSSMREEASKWGMVYSPYPPYEILTTKNISYEELMKLKKVEEVVDKYYNSQKFTTILKFFVNKFSTPFDFYFQLGMFMYKNGYFNRSIGATEYYEIFLLFNEEVLQEEEEILKEIIKFDYFQFNKKKWIPPFLERDLSKTEERKLRDALYENDFNIPSKQLHIEKYKVDVEKYSKFGIVEKEIHYRAYDLQNEKISIDVTSYVK